MVQRKLMAVLAATIATTMGGCDTTPNLKPAGKTVVPVETKADRAACTVHLLDEVDILLPPITTAGNQWAIVFNDSRFLKQLRPIGRMMNGAEETAAFLAIHEGHRLVRFVALPPGSREAEPSQTYEAVVEILPQGSSDRNQ